MQPIVAEAKATEGVSRETLRASSVSLERRDVMSALGGGPLTQLKQAGEGEAVLALEFE